MNGNLKALKEILFILHESYSGLEHKLVFWDSPTNYKQEAARVTALPPSRRSQAAQTWPEEAEVKGGSSSGLSTLAAKAKERT